MTFYIFIYLICGFTLSHLFLFWCLWEDFALGKLRHFSKNYQDPLVWGVYLSLMIPVVNIFFIYFLYQLFEDKK